MKLSMYIILILCSSKIMSNVEVYGYGVSLEQENLIMLENYLKRNMVNFILNYKISGLMVIGFRKEFC